MAIARRVPALLVVLLTVAAVTSLGPPAAGHATVTTSSVRGTDGQKYSVTNHLTAEARDRGGQRREWLLVWAGGEQDFLAVLDATKGSRTYGAVVNTATIDGLTGNEPHHMQYLWHKGQRVYAGGLMSDTVFVLDVSRLPEVRLAGVNLPADTPCGSVPDAFWVLRDGTAYGSYMGGPNVAGPCTYTNGETRVGNGFAGSPGEVVRIGPDGRTLAEAPAATAAGEDPASCLNVPALPQATCANPHGIQVREDLDRMVTSDFFEVRHLLQPNVPPGANIARDTVRIFDIGDLGAPKLLSVSKMPDGPRVEAEPAEEEPRPVMETTVTNRPEHRGAFASTMNGAIYYTPDITAAQPRWRQVFDDATAFAKAFPADPPRSGGSAGAWLQTSPDDRFLFHVVLRGGPGSTHAEAGLVYVLDIRELLRSGGDPRCSVDTLAEVTAGGAEPDCPALAGVVPIVDPTTGGPHWGAMDNFDLGRDGYYHETDDIRRLAVSNYFVAQTGLDGDHRVCLVDVGKRGQLSLDRDFRDRGQHRPCVDFDRTRWPHGARGPARPHGVLFAVADRDVR
ncbi:hypothetical protein [Lentzea sp. NBRC 102530]|uniref:hypothetical protein n=1 Tax=Lentzea sp. NBRC 102530 TaxID=3032201 RepID=UPI0024A19F15|nr:hypothetical protein [Lentzea sp. NBRC 102530]GLY49777.1 hypothetical protein Lesp01_34330 [Lentzea sp. NBRC 102530]